MHHYGGRIRLYIRELQNAEVSRRTCVRSDMNAKCASSVETFATVATSMLVVVPVSMATHDASNWITSFAAH